MELVLIDFNAKFTEDYMQWCMEHPGEAPKEEEAEDVYYDMYGEWLQTPKDWLGGKSPNRYFAEIGDARMYVSAWIEYVLEDIDLPDPLLACMMEKKDSIYPILLGILFQDDAVEKDVSSEELLELRAHAIHLVGEMDKPHPLERYVSLLMEQPEDSLFVEEAAEALLEAGEDTREPLIEAYHHTAGDVRNAILDVLSHMPGDDRVLQMLLEELSMPDADIAFIAACLGRLGDEGAIGPLKDAIQRPGISYLAFKEIKNAIEEISGEEIEEEDFSGDSVYDFLKGQEEQD